MKIINLIILGLLIMGCCKNEKNVLQNGDIIFCNYQNGELTSAIDEVTQTEKQTHYAHMGIIKKKEDEISVIHATGKRGVVEEFLEAFLRNENPAQIDVYRLKEDYKKLIPDGIEKAEYFLGLPYNSHYRMNDTCFYCSQLIYEIFKSEDVFQLEPMTFKNQDSDEFNPGWIKHYKELGMEIPEGEPGCNPNGMAASENIEFVFRLK